MTSDPQAPEDKDLDRWLAGLAGDAEAGDPVAEKLRETVSKQHRQFESEVDDLRLRRGRDRLLKAARDEQASSAPDRRASPWAIAASVALMATASLIGYQLYTGPDPAEVELIMFYGDLERPRGTFPTVAVDVEDPLRDGRAIGEQLTDAGIPFELRRAEDATLSLAVSVSDADEVRVLQEVLGERGGDIVDPGYYVIEIE